MNYMYILLTKREVKMAGYWPSSLFAFLWTELAWSIKDLLYGIKSSEKNYLRTWLFSSTQKETSFNWFPLKMLKWWRVPLYPDWINAENTIIWLVTFQIQIQIFKCSNSKPFFCLPVFVAKRIFKTHQRFCFLCFHSRWRFFWFHKYREIPKNLFTLAENNFAERKLSCTRLNFGEILFAGTKRAVPVGQYRSILPARVANQNTKFAAYCPLAELAI